MLPAIRVMNNPMTNAAVTSVLLSGGRYPGVVIGKDLASTKRVAFTMGALDPWKGHWDSYSLAELAIKKEPSLVVGRHDYATLLVHERRKTASRLRHVRGDLSALPKTAALLSRRVAHGPPATPCNTPAAKTVNAVDERLREAGIDFICDLAKGSIGTLPTPFWRCWGEPVRLVLVVPKYLSANAARVLARYARMVATDAPESQILVVADSAEARAVLQSRMPESSFNEVIDDGPAARSQALQNVRLGHVDWNEDSVDGHVGRIRNLARQVIRDGGDCSDITVITDDLATACYLKTELFRMGTPVRCAEGDLIPTRFSIRDAMCLLAAVHGFGRLQAVARIIRLIPGLGAWDIDGLHDLLRGEFTADAIDDCYAFAETRAALRALLTLHDVCHADGQTAISAAIPVLRRLANEKGNRDLDVYASAIVKWASHFRSVTDMLQEFWRLRTLLTDWSGYRGGSGIRVTAQWPQDGNPILVVMGTRDCVPPSALLRGDDVYYAPVAEDDAGAEAAHEAGLQMFAPAQ